MVKYYSFEIPKEGVSREVLEADLPLYLGRDAKMVDSHVISITCTDAGRATDDA